MENAHDFTAIEETFMPRSFTATTCAAFLAAVPVAANAEMLTWGQLDLRAGLVNFGTAEGNADDLNGTDPATYELSGRIGADWGAFGAQLDLSYNARDLNPSEDDGYYWGNFAALRANYDINDALALGAVYGAGTSGPSDDDSADLEFYALEGAYSAGAGTYGLQLGGFDSEDPDNTDAFHDGSFARVVAIYSLGNGGVIEGEIAYFDGQQDSGTPYSMHAVTWGVEYSQQVGDRPLAWSVGLDGGRYTNGDAGNIGDNGLFSETRVTLGLTAWFGDSDLATAKKRGVFSQPDFARIVEAGNSVD
jgi:hypothetical protein